MVDDRLVPIEIEPATAWSILALVQGSLPEEISRPIHLVRVNGAAESLHSDALELEIKLAKIARSDSPVTENFTVAELWTLVHSIPQTAWQGARAFLSQCWAGIETITTLPVPESQMTIDEDQITELFKEASVDVHTDRSAD
jgi:hypothetical protein